MPYLNLDLNYFDHPKTRRLVGILGPMSDVLPVRLWAYCGRIHPKDGVMRGYSAAEVAGVIGWNGDPNKAIRAMTEVGFLVATRRGFACKDWHQHEGHLEAFSRRAKSAAEARWSRSKSGHATSIAKKISSNAPSVPSVPTVPTTDNNRPERPGPEDLKREIDQTATKLTTSAAERAGDYGDYRLPKNFGRYAGVYVVNVPADECAFLLERMNPGPMVAAALKWRIGMKAKESGR